jgi:Dyp-type peroxidase family
VESGTRVTPGDPLMPLDLDQIQGNILGGFNKDHVSFLFFALPADQAAARAWIAELIPEVATATEVKAFNDLFRLVRKRHRREGVVEATWMNIALTYAGLEVLGVGGLDELPEDFRQGMRARAEMIGDVGDNAPASWPGGLGGATIHALMIVAADSGNDQNRAVNHFIRRAARHRVALVFEQDGMSRRDLPGHEHFGFKDGISQPGIRGFTEPNANNPDQGDPGQDLIEPGEFVLGYPRQPQPLPQPGQPGYPAPERPPEPDPLSPRPPWLKNGSYLVFRRLQQDVKGFLDFLSETAGVEGLSVDLLGAKLVGRYRSGAPLELANNDQADPGTTDPNAVDKDHINDFEYAGDPDGTRVPRAAHIRKAYPRDQDPPGEVEAERRRILRRGIPFGHSFHRGAEVASPYADMPQFPQDRGLCFACYQRSIVDQFEFIQQSWVNTDSFPNTGDGVDPLISQQTSPRSFHLPGAPTDPVQLVAQWVKTTGGEYFFAPSISALSEFTGL